MLDTEPLLRKTDFPPIQRNIIDTLQINLGYLCNLSCTHCHVNAGPKRTELMDKKTIDLIIRYLEKQSIKTLDVTGGAPEMNPHFEYLVNAAASLGVDVIDRCNLTILLEPGYENTAKFLADNKVIITASLPCYSEQNVSEQRGKGVFEQSIEALKYLNSLGYGIDPELPLHLVYNPNGTFLPPGQEQLQADYKKELFENYGIQFHTLLTITNMPISRFGGMLLSKGLYDDYVTLLKDNFSDKNLESVMCKSLISIDYEGYLYDCDFNQMLDWPMNNSLQENVIGSDKKKMHIKDLIENRDLPNEIKIGEHCYGCTAGQGSSCSGALS
ncbi:MAG: arsenosugar biosynthesis radical SAM (seleno)protein ArsS [Cellvibrionaceae bacterium]